MKKLVKWMNKGAKQFDWFDIKLIRLSTVGVALLVAKLWPPITSLDWFWYAGLFVVALIRPWRKIFTM